MEYRLLGNTNCRISLLTLGTMTWGEQNTEKEAHQQIDYALDKGINCLDIAEMYPVPANSKTYGLTETFCGNWLAKHKKRNQILIATKVCGPAGFTYIRANQDLDRNSIKDAITRSLKRLQTDYIDLYQLHWPSRKTNFFGNINYQPNDDMGIQILETLQAMAELVQEGLIRHIGVSNETAWGVMHYLSVAQQHELPRIVSIQNPYNLLNRTFEVGLAEVSWREKVSLLPYSPLAFGALSGKYLNNQQPPKARLTLFKEFGRYTKEAGVAATTAYVQLAREHGLDPAQMALAFVNQQPFVASNIIGATTMEQLKSNVASATLTLSPEVVERIEKLATIHSNPCP